MQKKQLLIAAAAAVIALTAAFVVPSVASAATPTIPDSYYAANGDDWLTHWGTFNEAFYTSATDVASGHTVFAAGAFGGSNSALGTNYYSDGTDGTDLLVSPTDFPVTEDVTYRAAIDMDSTKWTGKFVRFAGTAAFNALPPGTTETGTPLCASPAPAVSTGIAVESCTATLTFASPTTQTPFEVIADGLNTSSPIYGDGAAYVPVLSFNVQQSSDGVTYQSFQSAAAFGIDILRLTDSPVTPPPVIPTITAQPFTAETTVGTPLVITTADLAGGASFSDGSTGAIDESGITALPTGGEIDPDNDNALDFPATTAGTFPFTFSLIRSSDGATSAPQTGTITVDPTNAIIGVPQVFNLIVGDSMTITADELSVSATNSVDGSAVTDDIVEFSSVPTGGTATDLENGQSMSFSATTPGTFSLTYQLAYASKDADLSAPITSIINVTAKPVAPAPPIVKPIVTG
jgi:hypothetical protein